MTIDWSNIFGDSSATIIYVDQNWRGSAPKTDADIALLDLPSGDRIELQWSRPSMSYVVSHYDKDFELGYRTFIETASEAISEIRRIANAL